MCREGWLLGIAYLCGSATSLNAVPILPPASYTFARNAATALLSTTNEIPNDENGIVLSLGATTIYYAQVVPRRSAPVGILSVPYRVTTSGAVSCAPSSLPDPFSVSSAVAQVNIGGAFAAQAGCGGFLGPTSDAFSENVNMQLEVGKQVQVIMVAGGTITAGANRDNPSMFGAFEAWVDPTFAIDPTFPYANDFDLIFSSPGQRIIPEPATGALLPLALALLILWNKSSRHRSHMRFRSRCL
jgi:hypothetical protein